MFLTFHYIVCIPCTVNTNVSGLESVESQLREIKGKVHPRNKTLSLSRSIVMSGASQQKCIAAFLLASVVDGDWLHTLCLA